MSDGRHRRAPAPRAWRGVVAVLAAGVTTVAVLGGLGALPSSAQWQARGVGASADALQQVAFAPVVAPDRVERSGSAQSESGESESGESESGESGSGESESGKSESGATAPDVGSEELLPSDSGHGRRVVFSESRQRVWLVSGRQRVKRTYLVSGSRYDNLDPGSYEVYSRSEQASGIDDSGTMKWFVRFARGERAAIGFHDIPVADGRPVQEVSQLGTPLSHGCIRQRPADARALWRFAPLGTTVVVTG